MGERIFTQGTPAPACSVDPRTSRAPALRGPGRAGGGGRAAAAGLLGGPPAAAPIGCAAAPCSRRVPPATRPASSRPQPWSWFLQEGDAQGRDPSPRFAPEPGRARIKPSAGCGNPGSGSLRSAERRGRSLRLPAPPPLGPGCRSGVPSARGHTRRPERRGCTCSSAMKRVRENPLELPETFPAPGVAAAAAAA